MLRVFSALIIGIVVGPLKRAFVRESAWSTHTHVLTIARPNLFRNRTLTPFGLSWFCASSPIRRILLSLLRTWQMALMEFRPLRQDIGFPATIFSLTIDFDLVFACFWFKVSCFELFVLFARRDRSLLATNGPYYGHGVKVYRMLHRPRKSGLLA